MNSKVKGGIGVLKVAEYFVGRNMPVFSELLCDNSEFDLVVLTSSGLKSIQVRTTQSCKEESAKLALRCVSHGSRHEGCKYRRFSELVDFFALYVQDLDKILFISAEEIKENKAVVTFRFRPSRNGQTEGVREAEKYFLFPDAPNGKASHC